MSPEHALIAIAGILAGGVVNLVADAPKHGALIARPRYPDGSRRPVAAWLGTSALILRLRQPRPDASSAALSAHKLSWRCPMTELATAAMALLFAISDHPIELGLLYAATFTLIIVIDLEHRRIPLSLQAWLAGLALIDAALLTGPGPNLASALIGGVVGLTAGALAYALGWAFILTLGKLRPEIEPGPALGLGDVALMSLAGLLLGFPHILLALGLTAFYGAAGALAVIATQIMRTGRYQPWSTMPYGPSIVAALLTLMLIGDELASLLPGL